MMSTTKKILTVLAAVLVLAGCKENVHPPVYMPESQKGCLLTVDGKKVFGYGQNKWQSGWNESAQTYFNVSDDGDEWVKVTCSDIPGSTYELVTVSIEWKTAGENEPKSRKDLTAEVMVIEDDEDMIFLWDEQESTGVRIQNIRK